MNDLNAAATRRDALRFAFGGAGSLLAAGLLHELCAADEVRGRLGRPARAQGAALPRQGQARHLPVHDRRRLARRYLRPQAEAVRRPRQDRHHRRVAGQAAASTSAISKSRNGTSSRTARAAPRSATCSRTSAECVDDLCVIRSMQVGPHEPLRSDAGDAHRVVHVRPAEHRLLGQLRPGHGQPQPAVVRGAGAGRALRRRPDVGGRLPARLPPGHARRPGPDADRRPRPPPASADLQELERELLAASATRTTSTAGPATPSWRRGSGRSRRPSACSGRRRRRSTCRRSRTRRCALYGLQRGSNTGFGWQCLVARRLAERGVRFIELIDIGSSNNWDVARRHAGPRPAGQERRSAHRRPAHRPETARHARRHAGGLDDRVRPDAVPRAARRQGPRASPLGLLVLAGRRRRQGRPRPSAPPTTTASTSPRTPSTSTTSTPRSCTCWGWTTRS